MFVLFGFVGTLAFAASGAIVAMEEEYDMLGVFVLGLVTAFGGGVVRNLLIGAPVTALWDQGFLLKAAALAILIVFVLPPRWIVRWKKTEFFFDAVGLAAFAIQGATFAADEGLPLSAVMVAAMLTGIGGGMIRDIMARRKPLVLRDEIYAVWALLAGLAIGIADLDEPWKLLLLFAAVVSLRMLSVHYKWKLPRRRLGRGGDAKGE